MATLEGSLHLVNTVPVNYGFWWGLTALYEDLCGRLSMQIPVATADLVAAKSRNNMYGVEFCKYLAVASIIFLAANLVHIPPSVPVRSCVSFHSSYTLGLMVVNLVTLLRIVVPILPQGKD